MENLISDYKNEEKSEYKVVTVHRFKNHQILFQIFFMSIIFFNMEKTNPLICKIG